MRRKGNTRNCPPALSYWIFILNLLPSAGRWEDFRPPIHDWPKYIWEASSGKDSEMVRGHKVELARAGEAFCNFLQSRYDDIVREAVVPYNEIVELAELDKRQLASADELKLVLRLRQADPSDEAKRRIEGLRNQWRRDRTKFIEWCAAFAEIWFDRYKKLEKLKELLTHLAYRARNLDVGSGKLTRVDPHGLIGLNALMPTFIIDENGIFRIKNNYWFDFLEVDLRRLSTCSVCQNLFWAARLDKKSCSRKCANVHNQRISREAKKQYRDEARTKKK